MEGTRKPRVLVVDDEKVIRDFFLRLMSYEGIEAVLTEDGFGAVELLRKTKFDIIFLDVRMPGMDGLDTYRQIKKIAPDTSVVMMTGYALDELLDQAHKEGVYASIRKPFDLNEIKEIMDKISAGIKNGDTLNILIVDDDSSVLSFFSGLCANKKHRCVTLSRGADALALINEEKFNLVFLDLMLPDIDGVRLYKEVRKALPDTTIVIITAYPKKAAEIGSDVQLTGCLYKPFEMEAVLSCIEDIKARLKK